ncbi:hypothetical protein GBAR_LOCUS10703 [Geodia barretti]|uniref:Uncharacterized protein n=1 Tax=Geodia barretti TaxID=519541 RepID=A0AA35WHS1_GEOBA|nr:hypothetical protein GBAR_LOCUS10703 [Geodia barretti]
MIITGRRALIEALSLSRASRRSVSTGGGGLGARSPSARLLTTLQQEPAGNFRGRGQEGFPCLSRIREKSGPLEKIRATTGKWWRVTKYFHTRTSSTSSTVC